MGNYSEAALFSSRVPAFTAANEEVLHGLGGLLVTRFGTAPLAPGRVVAIAGPGCVGKSTLAEGLAANLRRDHSYDCMAVDLDGYLIEKSQRERVRPIISGYDPRGFELIQAAQDVSRWRGVGQKFQIKIYDKLTSRRPAGEQVDARDLLIIEGACAFFEPLKSLSDFKVFLFADKRIQFANRYQREKNDLSRSDAQINAKFAHLYPDYERYILPTLYLADVVLQVEENYRLRAWTTADFEGWLRATRR